MAQFAFESDLHSLLQLDTPIPNAPPARWQRKAKEAAGPAPSPMRAANRSHSAGRTPGRTPGKCSSKVQTTPSKPGGDRYIPQRSAAQMEVASFLLSKENQPENSQTPTKKEHQKAWALNLNGFDVEEAKILRLSGKPQNAPEGYQNRLKVLYSQKATPGSSRKTCRYIPSLPDRILDAPEIRNDYYLNLVDWSSGNVLAVALDNSVYLWSASSGDILQLLQMEQPGEYVSSVAWIKEGNYLAVGTSSAEVQLWDVQQQKRLRNMTSHSARVGSLSWNSYILSTLAICHAHTSSSPQVCSILWSPHYKELISGHGFSQNQLVIWKYPTMAKVAELKGHTSRVLSLTMSPDGATVASAAADETLRLWRCFELDPARRREREKANAAKSSLIHQGIR
ncbi:cell division cycle protein 20 homolog [Cebus imitator]|uniref:cell division cycle protein 20 homolog n=1 Tax=Cebus imitator TaxID=2715852 RepID=UPI000809BCFD|nr:cell division cycle protein 20 homolog [Cebus imitator]